MRFVDFKCNSCNNISEFVLRGEDCSQIICTKCGSKDMVRIFSPVSIKGSSKNEDFSSVPSQKSCSGGSCASCSTGCR